MADFPALPLFTDAYLGDTMHLGLEEHGAYLKLLMIAWRSPDCALPDDDRRLANMLGIPLKRWCEVLRPVIAPFWSIEGGRWRQKKLSAVRAKVAAVSEKRRAAAKAGHEAKSLINSQTGLANAPPLQPTLHDLTKTKTKTQEETPEAAAESRDSGAGAPASPYAFEGRVIRLTARDYDAWKAMAPHVPVEAKLRARDAWYADEVPAEERKRWFIATSAWLANLEQAELRRREAERERVAECGRVTDYRLDPKRWHLPG